ncbi:radical SAM protein [Ruminiclostridium papyrosolvens]|uniref:Radical SAM protein n=1 Tax=Ruminiclostridium papyrosolvens C7 TaxID=1330534 RepID=U4R1G6_9FIRM|nr:radical SAM protein [Ruminiclostridium papyrosolvens]EPR10515.1 radical SAM protein [Ruminiclostridium papyrosolvens C7]
MRSISVHLTDQCNNSCIFCVVNSHKEKREGVNKKVLYKFLEENANKGYESVNIHGGEATVLDDFLEILKKIQELGYPQVSLQTNARKLADIEYARKLYDKGVKLFVVSVHGKNAAQHDFVTQIPGSFEEAMAGIVNVKALGAKVRTNTVVYKDNIDSLTDIAELVLNAGVDHVNISAIHPVGKAYQNFHKVTPRYTEMVQSVYKMVDACAKSNKVVTLEGFPPCIIPGYEKYQIPWDENKFKLLFHNFVLEDYATFMEKETKKQGQECKMCIFNKSCGGVYKEYLEFYEWDEFKAVQNIEG